VVECHSPFSVAGVWISYVLLSPVSRRLILLDVFFSLVSLAVEAVSKLFLLLVLPILSSTGYLKAFEPHQLEILANVCGLISRACTCSSQVLSSMADRRLSQSLPSPIGASRPMNGAHNAVRRI
jgi:hypothetical protein